MRVTRKIRYRCPNCRKLVCCDTIPVYDPEPGTTNYKKMKDPEGYDGTSDLDYEMFCSPCVRAVVFR